MDSLGEIHATLKTGDERLVYKNEVLKFTLLDFWRWNSSDLVSNATRGRFAEYIVATATNIDISQVRDELGDYDLETTDVIKVEVKSSKNKWCLAPFMQIFKQHLCYVRLLVLMVIEAAIFSV